MDNDKGTARAAATFGRRRILQTGAALAATGYAARAPRAAGKAKLTMWTPGGSAEFCAVHDELLQQFARSGSAGAGADLQCGLGANAEYTQALLAGIASGNPPDISMLWDTPVTLGAQGAFMPLDEAMASSRNLGAANWPANLLKTCQFRGKTYGVPITAGAYGIWYNQEMFEAKGIKSDRASFPKTWAELRRLSKEFTQWRGDRLEVAGFMPPRQPEPMPIWSALNGTQIFDEAAMRYTIDSDRNVEMFTFFLDWLNEEYKGDVNAVDRSGHFKTIDPSDSALGLPPAFQSGRQAGLQAGSWVMGDLYAFIPPVFERWNVAQHPLGPSGQTVVSGTWPNWFVVPKGTSNFAEAVAYLDYLSVDGAERWYSRVPDLPVNLKVKPSVPAVVKAKRGEAFARDITDFFLAQSRISTPMWNSPAQSFGQDQLARAIEKIYTKAATVKDALATAQAASQAELARVLKS